MQNLMLPTSQTLALGATFNAMDATKNSVNKDKSSIQQNTSFEMMLKKQVKAQKETVQDKTAQQHAAHKNTNQNSSVDQKKSQFKPEQNEQSDSKEFQSDQIKHETLDANVSMAQMLDDAKALLFDKEVDKKAEELTNESALVNIPKQELSQEAVALAIPLNISIVSNNTSITKSTDLGLNKPDVESSVLELNTAQIKDSVLPQANSDKKSELQEAKQGLDLVGKELPQDRLLWASVSTSKSDQNASQSVKLVNSNAVDSTKFKDTVNSLSLGANQQNQLVTSNSVLPTQPSGSSNQINAYPGKTGWDQAISQKVVWMVGASEQSATLSLNPPDLGPLQVVINISNNRADTTFISNNAEVRQALQDGMANLREKMAESGIQLGQASISSGGQAKQEFQQNTQSRLASQLNSNAPTSVEEKVIITNTKVSLANGLVDTFA